MGGEIIGFSEHINLPNNEEIRPKIKEDEVIEMMRILSEHQKETVSKTTHHF